MSNRRFFTDSVRARVYTAAVVLFALVAVGAFSAERRFWGFNHLSYYSTPLRLGALACILVAFVPFIGGPLLAAVSRGLERFRRRGPHVLALVLAVIALVAFSTFRSETLLLGDGQLVANELKALVESDPGLAEGVARIVGYEHVAPLTAIVHFVAARVGHAVFGVGVVAAVAGLYVLLGAVLVFVMARTALSLDARPDLVLWLALLLPAAGSIQLFFGYVENYGLSLFFGAFFALSAYRCVHRLGRKWHPFVFWALTTASHVAGVLLLPAVIYLLFSMREDRLQLVPVFRALLIAIGVAAVAGRFVPAFSTYYRPLLSDETGVGLLSFAHSLDVLNELMLLAPAFLVVVLLLGRRAADTTVKAAIEDWHLALLMFVPLFLFCILFNAEIGMSRDWDLFVLATLGLIPIMILRLLRASHAPAIYRPMAPIVVAGLVLSIAWVGVNASAQRSIERYRDTLNYDRTLSAYALETLSRTLTDQERPEEALAAMEQACAAQYNPRRMVIMGAMRNELGDVDGAIAAYREIAERSPSYSLAREKLVVLLVEREDWTGLRDIARGGVEIFPTNPFYFYYLAQGLRGLGQEDAAREAERRSELLRIQQRRP